MATWHDFADQPTGAQMAELEYFEHGADPPAMLLRLAQRLVIPNQTGCWPAPMPGDGYPISGQL